MRHGGLSPSSLGSRGPNVTLALVHQETDLGMPISPFMDRSKTNIAQCQVGFINILIKPFFEEWAHFLGDGANHLVDNIVANIARWEADGESACPRLEQIKNGPDWDGAADGQGKLDT